MRYTFILLLTIIWQLSCLGQTIQDLETKTLKALGKLKVNQKEAKEHIDTMWQVANFYRKFHETENLMKGNVGFGFNGAESSIASQYNINTNVEIDLGVYPLELDVKSKLLASISNGKSIQNFSEIDISLDYHPLKVNTRRIKQAKYLYSKNLDSLQNKINKKIYKIDNLKIYKKIFKKIGESDKLKINKKVIKNHKIELKQNRRKLRKLRNADFKNTGLWFENFFLLKRFNNSFLGIDDHYDIGGGIILNKYSLGKLTLKGEKNIKELAKLPYYDLEAKKNKSTGYIFYDLIQNQEAKTKKMLINLVGKDIIGASIDVFFSFIKKTKIIGFEEGYPFFQEDRTIINRAIENEPENKEILLSFLKIINSDRNKAKIENGLKKLAHDTDHNLVRCYINTCKSLGEAGKPLNFDDKDIKLLKQLGFDYKNINVKKYAKWRFALLGGIYYELEKNKLQDNLLDMNYDSLRTSSFFETDYSITINKDSTFTIDNFDVTNKWRWELRPTIVWKPDDVFTISLNPYFKFPLLGRGRYKETEIPIIDGLNGQELRNEEVPDIDDDSMFPDLFFDLQADIEAAFSPKFKFQFSYRYLKDFSPRRVLIKELTTIPITLQGQNSHQFYTISLNYNF